MKTAMVTVILLFNSQMWESTLLNKKKAEEENHKKPRPLFQEEHDLDI